MNSSVTSEPAPSRRSVLALDALAFVQVGIGPFLAVYLQSVRHWTPARIGTVLAAAGFAGMLAQMPVGAVIDGVRCRRELYAVGAAVAALASVAIVNLPTFGQVVTVQVLLGVVSAIFPPVVAAISLGLVGRDGLNRRVGRNETFNHAGNAVLATLMGLSGFVLAPCYMFYFAGVLSLAAGACALGIRPGDIHHDWARGANGASPAMSRSGRRATGLLILLSDRRLMVFALSVVLFHLANAAMLPLAGQRLALGRPKAASLCMGICIVVSQLLMALVAGPASRLAGTWGRRRLFLVALCLLPARGCLFALSPAPGLVVVGQLLDGVSAAIFGVVSVLIVADLTQGTGHFNFAQGLVATATGVGASVSTIVAGFVVQWAGFGAAFLALAGVAGVGLLLFGLAMPETGLADRRRESRSSRDGGIPCYEFSVAGTVASVFSESSRREAVQEGTCVASARPSGFRKMHVG